MRSMTILIMLIALVSAHPHDVPGRMPKRETGATDFAKSIEDCNTRFGVTVYGGQRGEKQPSDEDVKRFKIGPGFHSQTAIVAQLMVKFEYSREMRDKTSKDLYQTYVQADNEVIAYLGPEDSSCDTVRYSRDAHSVIMDQFLLGLRSSESKDFRKSEPSAQDLERYNSILYQSLLWNPPKGDERISLWPYLLELKWFGECTTPWCTEIAQVHQFYSSQLQIEGLDYRNEQPAKWKREDLVSVLQKCGGRPVFFTNLEKNQEEDPAWIVTAMDGDRYILKMVRTANQPDLIKTVTVEEIVAQVLPSYPNLVHFVRKVPQA